MASPWTSFPIKPLGTQKTAPKNPYATTQDFFGRTPQAADVLKPISLPKVPGADPYIQQMFGDLGGLRNNMRADVAQYRQNVLDTQPQVAGYAQQDIAQIDRLLNPGGYEADMGNIRRQRQQALAGLNDQLMADLTRALNLNARGGASGTGLGSYLSRQAASEAGKIRANAAYDDANQARADLQTLMQARAGTVGKRQAITDALIGRLLNPTDKDLAAQSGYSTALQQALQAALANLTQAFGIQAYS